VRPDLNELADARWFRADDLPLVPPRISIARQLIDAWVRRQGGDPDGLRSMV
jgi:NAD+ diphosphatase